MATSTAVTHRGSRLLSQPLCTREKKRWWTRPDCAECPKPAEESSLNVCVSLENNHCPREEEKDNSTARWDTTMQMRGGRWRCHDSRVLMGVVRVWSLWLSGKLTISFIHTWALDWLLHTQTGGHFCCLGLTRCSSADEDVSQRCDGTANRLTHTGHVNNPLIVCHVWSVIQAGEKSDQDMMKTRSLDEGGVKRHVCS